MKSCLKAICCVLLVGVSIGQPTAFAQQKAQVESAARSALAAKGISEEEFQKKLEERGIKQEDLERMTPEEALRMQSTFEEIIAEIEAERTTAQSRNNIPSALDKKSSLNHTSDMSSGMKVDTIPQGVTDTSNGESRLQESNRTPAIWGQQFFSDGSLRMPDAAVGLQPPSGYVLSSGDRVSISIWGLSQFNDVYTIQEDGFIQPARMPRIFIKGLTLQKARNLVKNYFKNYYRFQDNQFDLTLVQARAINVNIYGEVQRPGSYTLSAINTAFNALASAGGFTSLGSVRKIKVIRKNKTTLLDVYKFMNDPSPEHDFYLENNDVIQVPVAEKTVMIDGAVGRPHAYELLPNENLIKLIAFAGGLKENAITKTLQIERIQSDRRVILDVPYADLLSKNADFVVKRGDVVLINNIRTQPEEFVYVNGAVRSDLKYQYASGMKLSELTKKIDFMPESNLEIAFIKRINADGTYSFIRVNLDQLVNGIATTDLELRGGDELSIFRKSTFVDQAYVRVAGAVRQEGKFSFNPREDAKIKDLILLAGGLKPDAFPNALLYRVNPKNNKDLEVIRVKLQEVMDQEFSDQNIYLKPYDSLVVHSASSFDESVYIEISGAVKNPGRYHYGKGMTLEDLIALANGFNYNAAANRVDVFRMQMIEGAPTKVAVQSVVVDPELKKYVNAKGYALEPYDIVVVRNQPEFQFQQMVQIEGEVKYPGPYALISPNERLSDLVKRAGGLTPESFASGATLFRSSDSIGYVVIDLKDALMRDKSHANIILKEGDYLFIPKQKDLVRIAGATNVQDLYPDKMLSNNNAISVAFQDGKSAKFYIDHYAAGISKSGDADKVTVEHANGRIDRTKQFLFFKVYPKVSKGSVINVGYKDHKPEKEKKEKKDVDWAKVVADSIAQATAILSLILLIDRLN